MGSTGRGGASAQIARLTRVVFEPGTPASAAADAVRSLNAPLAAKPRFVLEYALSEVLVNALRASAVRGAKAPVVAEVAEYEDRVQATVQDGAGGFDFSELPYDFGGPAEDVDIGSEAFDKYRARHHERRFGLGLLTTRKMVEDFSLAFVDASGHETEWRGPGSVFGTRVRFCVRGAKSVRERRRAQRFATIGIAALGQGMKAHVCDMSLGGLRMVFLSRPAPELGQVYEVRLACEGRTWLETRTRVRIARVDLVGGCYDVGAEFMDVDLATRSELERIVEHLMAEHSHGLRGKVRVEVVGPAKPARGNGPRRAGRPAQAKAKRGRPRGPKGRG